MHVIRRSDSTNVANGSRVALRDVDTNEFLGWSDTTTVNKTGYKVTLSYGSSPTEINQKKDVYKASIIPKTSSIESIINSTVLQEFEDDLHTFCESIPNMECNADKTNTVPSYRIIRNTEDDKQDSNKFEHTVQAVDELVEKSYEVPYAKYHLHQKQQDDVLVYKNDLHTFQRCSHPKCKAVVSRCHMHSCSKCGGDKRFHQSYCPTCQKDYVANVPTESPLPSNDRAVILLPRIAEGHLRRMKTIGKGSNSTVYQSMYDGMPACEKVLHCDQGPDIAVAEATVMAKCDRHPNILRLYGLCQLNDTSLAIVMELMESDLLQRLTLYRDRSLMEPMKMLPRLLSYLLQISHAIGHMHRNGIIHRDIAARNILISKDIVKVADFGLAMTVGDKEPTHLPKPLSTAPEAIKDLKNLYVWTKKCDVWSFGLLMAEVMSFGEDPLGEFKNSVSALLFALERGWLPMRPSLCIDSIWNLVIACLHQDPTKRPNFDQISSVLSNYWVQAQHLTHERIPTPLQDYDSHMVNTYF